MVHAACWTHARRGFANVVKLNPGDPVATPIVAEIIRYLRWMPSPRAGSQRGGAASATYNKKLPSY